MMAKYLIFKNKSPDMEGKEELNFINNGFSIIWFRKKLLFNRISFLSYDLICVFRLSREQG